MDLTNPKIIHQIRDKFGFTFKKGLGQNFLTSPDILERIAQAAKIDGGGVLEIGPGFGVLTKTLSQYARKVVSVEVDDRLLPVLDYTLKDCDNVKIIQGDVMKIDIEKLIRDEFGDEKISVAANLPYYITTPIITMLLEGRLPLNNIIVMVQKEVAQRLCAKEGTKDYGAITLLCRYHAEPEIIANVSASLFVPPPKVDSAVLRLRLLTKPSVSVKNERIFFKTVKGAFAQRRKTLLNCLCAAFPISKAAMASLLTEAGVEPSRRGETLSIEEFAAVSDIINDNI